MADDSRPSPTSPGATTIRSTSERRPQERNSRASRSPSSPRSSSTRCRLSTSKGEVRGEVPGLHRPGREGEYPSSRRRRRHRPLRRRRRRRTRRRRRSSRGAAAPPVPPPPGSAAADTRRSDTPQPPPPAAAGDRAGEAAGARSRPIANAGLAASPDNEDMQEYYPDRALRMSAAVKATVRCTVTKSARVTGCSILSEDPPDFGFGQATLSGHPSCEDRPKSVDGQPTEAASFSAPSVPGARRRPTRRGPGAPASGLSSGLLDRRALAD